MEPRRPADSAAEMLQVVLPNDTNPLGNALGGTIMHWIDLVAAIAAYRHSHRPVVTVSMDRLDFRAPIRLGHIVHLKAKLHYVGRTSMEVGVDVFAEDPQTGDQQQTSSALITYVALNDAGHPTAVPPLILTTDDERALFDAARRRRKERGLSTAAS
ncbi:MAG: acyl-CoA thioesterase [Nitrospirae bacterium]|nr:acyl-CoA thioesterase [Nitrospirota bacterium]